MVKKVATGRYEPRTGFEEVEEEAMIDISPTDSKEFWLIQWPKDKLDVSDFHGEELSLKLHDGNLGSLQGSSGKSYDLVSFASQQPDATVFLPSESEMKAVGKISRRVSLVRFPEPDELEKKTSFAGLTPNIKKSAGSRKTVSRFTSATKNRSSQGSAFTLGARSTEPAPKHKKIKDESSSGHSNVPGKASEGSHARGAESNATTPEKSKKKKKVKIAE